MQRNEDYGSVAKLFHWSILALIAAQFVIGWLMPDIRRGMQPGTAMNLHLSVGFVILTLMGLRLAWRLLRGTPPPEASLPAWQRWSAELVHGALYLAVFALTLSGWFFASTRGWTISVFGLLPIPTLVAQGSALGRAVGAWHGPLGWVLLGLVGIHAAAALAHALVFGDRVMQRMLPRFGRG